MLKPFFQRCRNTIGMIKTLFVHPKRIVDPSKTYYPECPHKSKAEIVIDQIRHTFKFGHRIEEYYLYGLDVKGADPSKYITETYNIDVLSTINAKGSVNYAITVSDKCLFSIMMHDNNMPIPATFGLIYGGNLYIQGDYATPVPMEVLLQNDCHLLCKPVRGYSGLGMLPIRVTDGKLYHKGVVMSIADFKEKVGEDTYLMQHFVENQHVAMKQLFPNVLNTLRVTMARTAEGIELLGVMCLMGSANSEYSNWHFGGICISVDENGRLCKYGFSNSDGRITQHPDTKTVFEGYQIPFYKETIDLCSKAMNIFYGLKTIGWDMAITEKGPIFIEGNHGWGVAAHQMVDQCGWSEKYHRILGVKRP